MKLYLVASKKQPHNMPARLPVVHGNKYVRTESFEAEYNPYSLSSYFGTFSMYCPTYLKGSVKHFREVRGMLFEKVIDGGHVHQGLLTITQKALKFKQQYPNHKIYLYEE